MTDSITLRVPAPGWIKGRNGAFDITGVEIWLAEVVDEVRIDGVGKRGKTINGGLRMSYAGFDAVCKQYLEARGYTVWDPNPAHDGGG